MERLFVYGTLMWESVQQRVIGRKVPTKSNVLEGYTKTTIGLGGESYPRIERDPDSIVTGMVMEVTQEELLRLDRYEGSAYERVKVVLNDETEAWAYVKPGE